MPDRERAKSFLTKPELQRLAMLETEIETAKNTVTLLSEERKKLIWRGNTRAYLEDQRNLAKQIMAEENPAVGEEVARQLVKAIERSRK